MPKIEYPMRPSYNSAYDRKALAREIVLIDYGGGVHYEPGLLITKINAGVRAAEELDRIVDEHRCTYREGKKIE